jgi:hypothetical protein
MGVTLFTHIRTGRMRTMKSNRTPILSDRDLKVEIVTDNLFLKT